MSKWINVKDRLPELHDTKCSLMWSTKVLCFLIDGTIQLMSFTNGGQWRDFDTQRHCMNKSVTHWMPLPEAPSDD